MNKYNLAGFIDNSLSNGEGVRSVIFLAGCHHNCEGCHNKEFQLESSGYPIDEEELLNKVKYNIPFIGGVTVSGGEPFDQDISNLVKRIKMELGLNIWVYTGFTYEQLLELSIQKSYIKEVLKYIDVLVDGKFILSLKDNTQRYTGSTNQRIIRFKDGQPQNL